MFAYFLSFRSSCRRGFGLERLLAKHADHVVAAVHLWSTHEELFRLVQTHSI